MFLSWQALKDNLGAIQLHDDLKSQQDFVNRQWASICFTLNKFRV